MRFLGMVKGHRASDERCPQERPHYLRFPVQVNSLPESGIAGQRLLSCQWYGFRILTFCSRAAMEPGTFYCFACYMMLALE